MKEDKIFGKRDRRARLLSLEHFLYQNPQGLKAQEIAERCEVCKKTAYRDLKAIESELKVPIWAEGGKWGIAEGYFLPPVSFSHHEALNIYLAARLMLSFIHKFDPNMASIFIKLNSVVPSPLKEQIQKTIGWMQKQPRDEKYLRTMANLAEAWISGHTVKIKYRSLSAKTAARRIIEPYFMEPAASGHLSYVIDYCHLTYSLRTFKIERIEDIEVTPEMYIIPPDFDANDYLSSSWGIVTGGEVKEIRLKFAPEIARIIEETLWHPSQVLTKQRDGSVIMTVKVAETVELFSWILGWGERVEVLKPASLRREIMEMARAMLEIYK